MGDNKKTGDNQKKLEERIMEYFTDIFKQKNMTKKNLTMFDKIIIDSSNSNDNKSLFDEKCSIIKNITHDYLQKYLEINDIICFSIPNDNFVLHEEHDIYEEDDNKVVGFSKNYTNERTIKLNYVDSNLPAYLTFDNSKVYITGNTENIENITSDLLIVNLKDKEKLKLCTFNGSLFSNYNHENIFYEKNKIFLIKKSTS